MQEAGSWTYGSVQLEVFNDSTMVAKYSLCQG